MSFSCPAGARDLQREALLLFPTPCGDAGKGDILFLEREYPPYTPKRKDEGPSPSAPNIAGLRLEEMHTLRNVSAVYMASP